MLATTLTAGSNPATLSPPSLAATVARYCAHNDALAARYPELATERARRESAEMLAEARKRLGRRDLAGAVASLLDTVQRVVSR